MRSEIFSSVNSTLLRSTFYSLREVLIDDHSYSLSKNTAQEQSMYVKLITYLLSFAGRDIPSEIKRSILVRVEISREVIFLNC